MKNYKKIAISMAAFLFVTLIAAVAIFGVNVYSKYLHEKEYKENQIKAESFYFTLDLLGNTHDETSLSKTITIHGGAAQDVSFNVQNFFDDMRITPKATAYTVKMQTELSGVALKQEETLFSSDGVVTEYSTAEQTIEGGTKASTGYTLSIPKLDNEDLQNKDNTITLTARSSDPYVKEMKLIFVVEMYKHDVEYYIIDGKDSPYAELIILANVDVPAGRITIDWTAINTIAAGNVFQVDTTNKYVLDDDLTLGRNDPTTDADNERDYLASVVLTQGLNSMESISIYFFKDDWSKNYEITRENRKGAAETVVDENTSEYKITLE